MNNFLDFSNVYPILMSMKVVVTFLFDLLLRNGVLDLYIWKIGGFVKLLRMLIDTDSNPDDNARIVRSKDRTIMEENKPEFSMSDTRKDAIVHDLIRIVKSAMSKVSAREQMWCDILDKTEKDIRRTIDETMKPLN